GAKRTRARKGKKSAARTKCPASFREAGDPSQGGRHTHCNTTGRRRAAAPNRASLSAPTAQNNSYWAIVHQVDTHARLAPSRCDSFLRAVPREGVTQAVEHLRRTLGAHRQVKVRFFALQDVHEVNWEMSRMPPPTCLTQQPRGFDQFALGQMLSARSVHATQPTAATETDPLSTRPHHRLLPTRRLAYFGLLQPP
ncbi:hypothetical protein TraAM80_10469, partial [Trypanosoma rangeli]